MRPALMASSDGLPKNWGAQDAWKMMKLNSGQSRAALGISSGVPSDGFCTAGSSGLDVDKPLWMAMLKKPGRVANSRRVFFFRLVSRNADLLASPPRPRLLTCGESLFLSA